jgi:hypothetical protein
MKQTVIKQIIRKITRTIVLFYCAAYFCIGIPALGQAVFSGSGAHSGGGRFFGWGAGAPLTYSARTDNCVSGLESGCVAGATTGQSGSALRFLLGVADAVPFSEQAVAGTGAYDPDFGSYEVLASDQNTSNTGTPYQASWHMGSDGAWDAFSTDERLLLLRNSGGGALILYLDPTAIHAHACVTSPSPNCVINSGIYSGSADATHLASGGSWSFSRVSNETNVLYELANPPTQINRLRVCRTSADPGCAGQAANTLIRSLYVDFTADSPVGCSVLPPSYNALWTGSFQIANDGSVSYGMSGGGDWAPSWTPAVNETFILPTVGNSGSEGFQATSVAGGTGATEPAWSSACNTTGSSCSDGGVIWTNIGGLNSQGPGFDFVVYRPAQGCTRINTRIGKVYRGTGNGATTGYLTTNDDIACTRAANGGVVSKPCRLPDIFTLHEVEQGQNGRYVTFSATGGGSPVTPGSWNSGTLTCQSSSDTWNGAYSSGATYSANSVVSYGGLYYTSLSSSNTNNQPDISPAFWTNSESYCPSYFFDTLSTLVAPCSDYSQCSGHNAAGYLQKYYGKRYAAMLYSSPMIAGDMNPGTNMLGASLPCDNHGTYRNAGTNDSTPIFMSTTDVPGWPTRYVASCYAELCAAASDGSGLQYRFGHDWNDGSVSNFAVQNAIGVISPLGDLMAFGTDMMGTRGSNTAANTTCNKLRGTYQPAPALALNVGDTVFPVTGNPGGYVYQTTAAGASVTATPSGGWDQAVGDFVPYGSATLQNTGASNCRGDVVVLDVLSAHQ